MARENKIASYINAYLDLAMRDQKFAGMKTYGLTEIYDRGKDKLPAEVDSNGELIYVGIDDCHPVIIYHRCDSTTSVMDKNNFGAGRDDVIETSQMRLFAYAQNQKVKMSAAEMKDFLYCAIPGLLDKTSCTNLGIKSANITVTGCNFNSLDTYKKEYKLNRAFNPAFYLIEIKYSIECRMKKPCVDNACIIRPETEIIIAN